ncbi:hypothetical protein C8R42DRAFT_80601 [Lentinula raphanica]|nr:hypothetical protein C8R42DRAFT_80601 [Lentinula raphanica]
MSSTTPTASENDVADQIGSSAYFEVVYILGASLFYGLSIPIFALAINILRLRARNSSTTNYLLIFLYLTFFLVTGQFISNVGDTLSELSWSQSPSSSISYLDRMDEASFKAQPYGIASLIFQVLNFFSGDAIVVWRATVFWSTSRAVRYILYLLLAGSAAASIYDVTNFTVILIGNKGTASGSNGFLRGDAASMFCSLAVNIVATSCIMVKAWFFRQSIRDIMTRDKVNRHAPFRILLSLVECGLLYCAAQATSGILTVDNNGPSVFGRAILAQFTVFFAGTHMALVISIIASQRSILENSPAVFNDGNREPAQDVERAAGRGKPCTMQFARRSDLSREGTTDTAVTLGEYTDGSVTMSTVVN